MSKAIIVFLACDTPPLPEKNIIKLSQIVWELWLAQDFGIRGDKYIPKKEKVVSPLRNGWILLNSISMPKIVKQYYEWFKREDILF